MAKQLDEFIVEKDVLWPMFITDSLFKERGLEGKPKEYVEFLCHKFSFGYQSAFDDTFIPLFRVDEEKINVFEYFNEPDLSMLKEIADSTNNVFLLAKIYDVLFICDKNIEYCKKAISNFIKIIKQYISVGNFFSCKGYLKRALFLMQKSGMISEIDMLINDILFDNQIESAYDFALLYNAVFDFLEEFKSGKIDKKSLVLMASKRLVEASYEYLKVIKTIIDYYSSTHEMITANEWANKYADVCEELGENQSLLGYEYIRQAIDMLSKFNGLNQKRIDYLEFRYEEEQQKLFDSMNFQEIQIDKSVSSKLKLWLETIINCFKNEHNSIKQFLYFLKCFEPVTEKEINEFLSELNKSVYTKSVKEVVFNSDKRIISESSPDDVNGRNKQNIIMAYKFFHFIYSNVASGYLENIVSDKNLLNSIKEILSHNYR